MNDKKAWNVIYDNFKLTYPTLSKDAVDYRPFGYQAIMVYFEDGTKMIYDDIEKQARFAND